MTTTPETAELLALKSRLDNANSRYSGGSTTIDISPEDRWTLAALVEAAIAAKSADEERKATIEECAKILDGCAQDWNRIRDPGMANNARAYARKIRALSTTGEPKR